MHLNSEPVEQSPEWSDVQVRAAIAAAEDATASPAERAEMLMEIARGLQLKPRSAQQLHDAVRLYERALALAPATDLLLAARIKARQGTALQALPDGGAQALEAAMDCYLSARAVLESHGNREEAAEVDMNLGLVTQALSGLHRARVQDAIAHYHRALRVFDERRHPSEFAILHNNLAIAYLSIPGLDERGKLREALAVQSFEQVLKVITLIDHPSEYAMAQNNLGNALQYAPSSHPLHNLLRAVEAYDEALKVRTARDTPVEYANTIANKANALLNLPDDPEAPEAGNPGHRATARALYREARALFAAHGLAANVSIVDTALAELDADAAVPSFGESIVPAAKELS